MDEPTCVSTPMGNESESKWPIVPLPDTDTIFPVRLHEMLDWARTAGMSHIVSWCSHGRMFRVSDKDAFMEKVLPRFFKSTKFRSFTRQLLLWGFRRETKGPDANAWYHESFRKDAPRLALQLKRTSIKGCKRGGRSQATKQPIPNFYAEGPGDMRGELQSKRRASVSFPMPTNADSLLFLDPEEDAEDLYTTEIRSPTRNPTRRVSDFVSSAPAGGGCKYDNARTVSFLPALPYSNQHPHDPSLYTFQDTIESIRATFANQQDVVGGFTSPVHNAPISSSAPISIPSAVFPEKIASSLSDFSTAESADEYVDEFSQFIEKTIHCTHE